MYSCNRGGRGYAKMTIFAYILYGWPLTTKMASVVPLLDLHLLHFIKIHPASDPHCNDSPRHLHYMINYNIEYKKNELH